MKGRSIWLSLVILALAGSPAWAEPGDWVDVEGVAALSGNTTPDQARSMALNQARAKAVQQAAGVSLQDTAYQVRTGEGSLRMFRETEALARGAVVEEHVLGWDTEVVKTTSSEPPMTRLKVRLRAKVRRLSDIQSALTVRLELNQRVFRAGENLTMNIAVSQPAYLTVFNLAADDQVHVIYPNRFQPVLQVSAPGSLRLPPADAPFKLRPRPLDGHGSDVEAIKVIASERPLDLSSLPGAPMSVPQFYRWLLEQPVEGRHEATMEYQVLADSPHRIRKDL